MEFEKKPIDNMNENNRMPETVNPEENIEEEKSSKEKKKEEKNAKKEAAARKKAEAKAKKAAEAEAEDLFVRVHHQKADRGHQPPPETKTRVQMEKM